MPFNLQIVTPESIAFEGVATSLKLRTSDGEMMVMGEHTAFVSDLVASALKVTTNEGTQYVAVDGGYMQVDHTDDGGTRTTVLVGMAETAATEQEAEAAAQRLAATKQLEPVEN